MATIVTTFFIIVSAMVRFITVVFGLEKTGRPHHRINTWWGRSIIRLMPGWKVTVYGKENVPTDDEVLVIVANHESMSDICAIYHLDLQFRWLSKEEVFKIFGVGPAMRWTGYVSIRRGVRESHAQAMQESAERIRGGASMFFFPEGTRSPDGVIKPFKNGAFKLARDEKVRILPVAIHGAGNLLPKGRATPGKAHVKIKVLPMIAPPKDDDDLDAFAEKVRQDIIRAHATLV
jgi:1-acyl-sn-glycerol-3-phosphate acyltransferase